MKTRLLLLIAVSASLTSAPAAWAAGKKKPAPPRPLNLTLSAADLDPIEPEQSRGLHVSMSENPWRALEEDKSEDLGGARIPQLDRDEPGGRSGINQNLLVRVLDGETIPLLTIRVVPPPSPSQVE